MDELEHRPVDVAIFFWLHRERFAGFVLEAVAHLFVARTGANRIDVVEDHGVPGQHALFVFAPKLVDSDTERVIFDGEVQMHGNQQPILDVDSFVSHNTSPCEKRPFAILADHNIIRNLATWVFTPLRGLTREDFFATVRKCSSRENMNRL